MSDAKAENARTAAQEFDRASRKIHRASKMCSSAASRDGMALEKLATVVTEGCSEALTALAKYLRANAEAGAAGGG